MFYSVLWKIFLRNSNLCVVFNSLTFPSQSLRNNPLHKSFSVFEPVPSCCSCSILSCLGSGHLKAAKISCFLTWVRQGDVDKLWLTHLKLNESGCCSSSLVLAVGGRRAGSPEGFLLLVSNSSGATSGLVCTGARGLSLLQCTQDSARHLSAFCQF